MGSMIQFHLIKEKQTAPEWSGKYSFLISLSGRTALITQKTEWLLREKDIFMVPPFQYFLLSKVEGCCLVYQIDFGKLPSYIVKDIQNVKCNSVQESNKERYEKLAVSIMRSLTEQRGEKPLISSMKWVYIILEELMKYFLLEKKEKVTGNSRMKEIMDYIAEHYKEDLTLTRLASHFYVSNSYISKMFREEVGVNFLGYLNEIRLMHAAGQLLDRSKTIEQIAEEYGFKNVRAFSTKFKDYYHMLPSEFRKREEGESTVGTRTAQNHIGRDDMELLEEVLLELNSGEIKKTNVFHWKKQMISGADVEKSETVIPCQRILTIRKADHLLMYQIRESVKKIVQELGFTGIYFHELFNDDMEIYSKDSKGRNIFSFYKIDHLFDFLIDCNVILYVELSFVPFLMAEEVNVSTMVRNSVSDMPKDMQLWKLLVKSVTEHLIWRYGSERVRQWKFCVWNSPDNIGINKSAARKENYYELYEETYKTIKEIDPQLQVGTPALMTTSLVQAEWMNDFASFYRQIACEPDFVMFNLYTVEHELKQNKLSRDSKIIYDRNILIRFLKKIYENNRKNDWRIKNWIIAEWNYDLWGEIKLQDSLYQADYLIRSFVDFWEESVPMGIADPVEGYYMGLQYPAASPFHGKRGLVTMNGLKKTTWYACEMVSCMGQELIRRGENFLITRTKDQIQILLYNYQHLSKAFCDREIPKDQYIPAIFEDHFGQEYEIYLENMKSRTYMKETVILNKDHGSALDFCENYYRIDDIPCDTDYLNQKNQPLRTAGYVDAEPEGCVFLYEKLQPLEIRLILLTPV